MINSKGGRPTLSVGSTIPQAGVSHRVKRIKQTVHQHSRLCFLALDAMTVSYLVCHAIPAMILESKINLSLLKWHSVVHFNQKMRKVTKTEE